MCFCSNQSSLFSFYAPPFGGKSKGTVVHCKANLVVVLYALLFWHSIKTTVWANRSLHCPIRSPIGPILLFIPFYSKVPWTEVEKIKASFMWPVLDNSGMDCFVLLALNAAAS